MPQKRNPVSCVYIHACALGRAAACRGSAGSDGVGSRTARAAPGRSNGSRCPTRSLLTVGRADACALARRRPEVDDARMRANLDITHGLIASEAVMMGLGAAPGPRSRARPRSSAVHEGHRAASTAVRHSCRDARDHAPCRRRRLAQAMRSGAISRFVRGDGVIGYWPNWRTETQPYAIFFSRARTRSKRLPYGGRSSQVNDSRD